VVQYGSWPAVSRVEVATVPTPVPEDAWSSPSQSAELPVSAAQVAGRLPKETTPLLSIAIAAVVEVAKVEADDVAMKRLPLMERKLQ
jgi:hypothetical protein